MKNLALIIGVLVIMGITIISCDSPVVRGRQMYESYFEKTLKDPESFKVYSEKYKEGAPEGAIDWELDYGAKNSLGGMERENIKFSTFYGGQGIGHIFINGEWYDYQELK